MTITLFAAIVVGLVGLLILWSNPRRLLNRTAFLCSFNIAAWLALRHITAKASADAVLYWLRLTYAAGTFGPLSFWLVKESILLRFKPLSGGWLARNWPWIAVPCVLAVIPLTDFFIPSHSTPQNPVYGPGYQINYWGIVGMYFFLLKDAVTNNRVLDGAQKVELQVWIGGGCIMAFALYGLMGLSYITKDPSYFRLRPLVILVFYAGIGYSITTHRIFDARQLLLVALQKFVLISSVAASAFGIHYGILLISPQSTALAFLLMVIFALWLASVVNAWLNRLFQFYPQAIAARQAAFAIARRESRLENLESAFLGVLKGWGQCDHALLLSGGGKEALRGAGIEISGDAVVVEGLRHLRWVTPERLAREKETSERAALNEFLVKNSLGALVIGEGPTLTAFIGVGIPASRRPFTFPQITQLMELASIIESALERAHFSVKAQHAEQLATVGLLGASLAHEIRNPLVSIKTFVQLLPTHHQDPAFRAKFFSLIGEEVSRIDRLTEQLLDLASPRAYIAEVIELHPVLRASLDLVTAKAADKRIQFLTDLQASPDQALTDASAAKQVLLNLCFNAIQAVETRPGDRWVKVSTRNVNRGVEMLVEDSGPGIAPEIRSKLFQPFHSTKSTGFGLGLAICSDILGGLNATISVDSSVPGQGAVFRVIFPCPVLSSS